LLSFGKISVIISSGTFLKMRGNIKMTYSKEQNKFLENGPKEMGYINYLVKNSKLPS